MCHQVPEDDQEGEEINDPELMVRGKGVTPKASPQVISVYTLLYYNI